MPRICIFCGSALGTRAVYAEVAAGLGSSLVARGLGLVFGGGHIGLMGVLADAVLAAGGEAIGVIPRALVDRELAHRGLTRLHVVSSMHERKALMADLADGFIALPGGFGTADEMFEILTWAQLGLHAKPVGVLNVEGYFDALLAWLDRAVADGFLHEDHRSLLITSPDTNAILDELTRRLTRPRMAAEEERREPPYRARR